LHQAIVIKRRDIAPHLLSFLGLPPGFLNLLLGILQRLRLSSP
jgi:hypothetical protein